MIQLLSVVLLHKTDNSVPVLFANIYLAFTFKGVLCPAGWYN